MDSDTKAQVDLLIKEFQARGNAVHTNLEKAVAQACLYVENTAKKSMRNTEIDSGTVYIRGSVKHSPSVEGNPPAIDTGRLVQSITHRIETSDGGDSVTGYVGTNVEYGSYLEYGTSKMQPRPWLAPALEANREKIKEVIGDAVAGREITIGGGEE